MDRPAVERIAREQLETRTEHGAREPGWLLYHGLRTAKIALDVSVRLRADVDRDALYAGGLFHDIGKGVEPHNTKGAELTSELLRSCCTPEQLQEVTEIIALHNQRQKSSEQSLAVRIVQDADLLDHVGPIVPWLAFYWSGAHNETVQEHIRFITGKENERYRKGMRDWLNLDCCIRMFDERVRWEDDFFRTFRSIYFEGTWKASGIG